MMFACTITTISLLPIISYSIKYLSFDLLFLQCREAPVVVSHPEHIHWFSINHWIGPYWAMTPLYHLPFVPSFVTILVHCSRSYSGGTILHKSNRAFDWAQIFRKMQRPKMKPIILSSSEVAEVMWYMAKPFRCVPVSAFEVLNFSSITFTFHFSSNIYSRTNTCTTARRKWLSWNATQWGCGFCSDVMTFQRLLIESKLFIPSNLHPLGRVALIQWEASAVPNHAQVQSEVWRGCGKSVLLEIACCHLWLLLSLSLSLVQTLFCWFISAFDSDTK